MKNIFNYMLLMSFVLLISCTGDDKNCGRLSCLPNPAVNTAISNTGKSVIETTGGIDGIVIFQYGTTVKAYDKHDPNRCTTEPNSTLTLSSDKLFLISDDGEYFLLQNGQPTKGISCRSLIQYRTSSSGMLITITD